MCMAYFSGKLLLLMKYYLHRKLVLNKSQHLLFKQRTTWFNAQLLTLLKWHLIFCDCRYGGGPAVNHLYVCHTCQMETEKIEKRRKTELEMFIRVIHSFSLVKFFFIKLHKNSDPEPVSRILLTRHSHGFLQQPLSLLEIWSGKAYAFLGQCGMQKGESENNLFPISFHWQV